MLCFLPQKSDTLVRHFLYCFSLPYGACAHNQSSVKEIRTRVSDDADQEPHLRNPATKKHNSVQATFIFSQEVTKGSITTSHISRCCGALFMRTAGVKLCRRVPSPLDDTIAAMITWMRVIGTNGHLTRAEHCTRPRRKSSSSIPRSRLIHYLVFIYEHLPNVTARG